MEEGLGENRALSDYIAEISINAEVTAGYKFAANVEFGIAFSYQAGNDLKSFFGRSDCRRKY
jgi:hypothetical protein